MIPFKMIRVGDLVRHLNFKDSIGIVVATDTHITVNDTNFRVHWNGDSGYHHKKRDIRTYVLSGWHDNSILEVISESR